MAAMDAAESSAGAGAAAKKVTLTVMANAQRAVPETMVASVLAFPKLKQRKKLGISTSRR
ncbi:MAG: hypothetical protein ABR860_01910 [Terracidiphilus sp.]